MPQIEATGDALIMVGTAHPNKISTLKLIATESGLLDAVRQGSQDGFAQLYKQYSPMVHGILLARVPYGEVADLVQDVFLTAYRQLRNLRDDNAFGGWLATIARNRANDFHRRSVDSEELTEAHHGQRDSDAEAMEILMVIKS